MRFETALLQNIIGKLSNYYNDNFDDYRFGSKPKEKKGIKGLIINFLRKRGFRKIKYEYNVYIERIKHFNNYFEGLNQLYTILADNYSKDLLIQIFSYRILGYRKVKILRSDYNYHKEVKRLKYLEDNNDKISIETHAFNIYKMNLKPLNLPITLYYSAAGVFSLFILKQYQFSNQNIEIKPSEGDIIIDCGGCWGDTALCFSNLVGINGRIYSFEFVKFNLDVYKKNLDLNPDLKSSIEIIERPIWEFSDIDIYFKEKGPSTRISFDEIQDYTDIKKTISIDDFVLKKELKKVDFIKMDIEGAELNALKGAQETIKKYKPKLAISLYHNIEDFIRIPHWIKDLNLGYKFYLGHYTIHAEETILYAITN